MHPVLDMSMGCIFYVSYFKLNATYNLFRVNATECCSYLDKFPVQRNLFLFNKSYCNLYQMCYYISDLYIIIRLTMRKNLVLGHL